MSHTRAMIIVMFCLAAVACCDGGHKPQDPVDVVLTPRLDDGRVAPTEAADKFIAYANEAERLKLIQAAQASRTASNTKYPPPVVLCKRVPDGSITVDGKLDDEAWKTATPLTNFRNTRDGTPAKLQTVAKMAWDSKYLYVCFDCPDTDLVATVTKHDGDIWSEDAAEIFIDASGGGTNYIELEISPRNVTYDGVIADYRPEVDWANPRDMGHIDMLKSIKVYETPDTRSAVQVDGTLNNSTDTDRGWTCEYAIAWTDLAHGTNARHLPPREGDDLRIGLYRINIKSQGNPDEYAAWNPTGTWFHCPWSFGHVIFVK